MDFHKDITTTWIAPGSSRDPMEKSLKLYLHLLTLDLTWLILFARKRHHGKITEIKFIAFYIWPNNIYLICYVSFIILNRASIINLESFFSWDSLTIYDGDSTSSSLIGKFCGNSLPPGQILSSSNELLLHFQTDPWAGIYDGFHIEYSSLCKFHRFILFGTNKRSIFF